MKKLLFGLIGIGVFILLAFYYFQDIDYKPRFRLNDNSYMEGVNIVQRRDGKVRLVINADKAIFETETDVKLISLNLYYPERDLKLTAETGRYDTKTKNVVVEGDVKADTKGYDITTAAFHWDAAKSELVSDEKVRIVGKTKGFYVEGDRLTSQGDRATLHNNVKAIFGGKQ
jgi:LPS export ABC transporter protein LptC